MSELFQILIFKLTNLTGHIVFFFMSFSEIEGVGVLIDVTSLNVTDEYIKGNCILYLRKYKGARAVTVN